MADRGEINKRAVDALKPADNGKSPILWDGKLPGFGVRCQPTGVRFYFVKFRAGKRQRWITIGRHGAPWTPEKARAKALALLGQKAEGADPGAQRDAIKDNPTIEELADSFLEDHADAKRKESTAREYRRLVKTVVTPELGQVRVCDLAGSDIAALHNRLKKTPYQANRVLAVLSKMFAWAAVHGVKVNGNPARGIERYDETKGKRKLFLGAAELAKIGAAMQKLLAAGELEEHEAAAIRMLLFTGCRLNEILALRWTDVDKGNATLKLPDSKTGAKLVPLSAPALAVLKTLPHIKGNPFVIPSPRLKKGHLVNLQTPWRAVRKKAGLSHVRLHDLRHAYAAMGAGIGLGLPVLGAILGHSQAQTTKRYAHVHVDPLKAAADAIGARLEQAIDKDKKPAEIVDIHERKRASGRGGR